MAIRPNSHITGDSAIRKIASDLIPEEWTISIPDADYGLDMLVEVVRSNKTTGKLFFLQSKGTIESSTGGRINYTLSIERIKDYSDINLPVLFVLYSKADNMFWGRWMNTLYSTLTEKQKEQETVSLHFSTENVIDADYLRGIGDDILPSISNQVALVCNNLSDLPEEFRRFHFQVISTARHLIGNDLSVDNHLNCRSLYLSYEGTIHEGSVEIKRDSESIRIPLHSFPTDILFYPSLEREECPDCLLGIIYVIALFSLPVSSDAINYALSHPQREVIKSISFDVWRALLNQASLGDIHEVSGLFDLAIQECYHDLAQLIILHVFMRVLSNKANDEFYRDLTRRFLLAVRDDNSKGLLCYNLANSLRKVDIYEAFDFYMKAVHFEPKYRDLFYWWQEMGGVLYLTNHYIFAEHFYKKARKISLHDCRDDISFLISDCLVCQGKIKEATLEESSYCDTHTHVSGINRLKCLITNIMDSRQITIFDNVYWFNQGVKSSQEAEYENAMNCFLFAWRLNDGDIEALVNSFIESYNVKDAYLMALIIETLRNTSPEEGYKRIVSALVSYPNGYPEIGTVLDAVRALFFEWK